MKSTSCIWAAMVVAAAGLPQTAQGQVVREEGAKQIAGVLFTTPGMPTRSEWTFRSAGGEILFASLDADIYRVWSEHEAVAAAPSAAEPGCSGDDEGGPGLFRLKVLDEFSREVCAAGRPAPPPGWMRDPRMACVLPTLRTAAVYRLRVELANPSGEVVQAAYPFVLNLSLRRIAPTGTNIQSAVATSSAGGF